MSAGPDDGVLVTARAWLAQDPDAQTRAQLSDLIARVEQGDAEASAELAKKLKELDATTATKELTGLEEDHPLFAAVAEKVKKVQGEQGESS